MTTERKGPMALGSKASYLFFFLLDILMKVQLILSSPLTSAAMPNQLSLPKLAV